MTSPYCPVPVGELVFVGISSALLGAFVYWAFRRMLG